MPDHRSSPVHTPISRRPSAIRTESKRSQKKMKPKNKEQLPSSTHGTTRIQRCFNFQVEQEHNAVKMKQHDLPLYTEPVFFL